MFPSEQHASTLAFASETTRKRAALRQVAVDSDSEPHRKRTLERGDASDDLNGGSESDSEYTQPVLGDLEDEQAASFKGLKGHLKYAAAWLARPANRGTIFLATVIAMDYVMLYVAYVTLPGKKDVEDMVRQHMERLLLEDMMRQHIERLLLNITRS